ncbi:pyridoxamine 5'-phosphate oxidase family protein [Nocardioides sp.]|uniref:pyridoxamine 5'-phosphate oxidase family protein n=1 Tax=Nocardioides sp. TaxID=35761 RepID=UPI003D0BEBD0
MTSVSTLSPTPRTTVSRGRNRAVAERAALYDVLDTALVCHLGVDVGHPLVIPTAFAYDRSGPDEGGTLYLHGSVASGSIRASPDATICVTMTVLDGVVAARSAFHHSMNYRSAVVLGRGRLVTDATEKDRALELIVDHVVPGRMRTLRPNTRKELAATSVVALPLHEASVKVRSGPPVDDAEDIEAGVWGGVIPLRMVAGEVIPDAAAPGPVPHDVRSRAAALR